MSDYVWLNKNARQFLERDYLLPGQTVDERVNVICEEAGKLLKDKKFASKFKDYIQKGYYSLSTPVWTNFGTNRGLPISCITGNMPVNVKTGDLFGFKKASQIVIGDLLLTHLGNYKPVSNIIVTPKRNDIYHLKVYSNDLTIHITGNHLIYTPQGWTRCENLRVGVDLVGTMENGRLHYWPIESLVLSEDVETVYDFTVEDDHSFCVSDLIVHNCYGSHIEDSMEAILDAHSEIGMMTKFGGGTSAYFGDLRGRGASIHNNGSSSGAVHFISMFENLINIVSQGNCYIEGTEVLTNHGFKDFRDLSENDNLAQADENNKISFTSEYEKVKKHYVGKMISFISSNLDLCVTPNHRMVINRNGVSEIVLAKDLQLSSDIRIPVSGYFDNKWENAQNYYSVDALIMSQIQAHAALCGLQTFIKKGDWHDRYSITLKNIPYIEGNTISKSFQDYDGMVYCAIVPQGRLIVRYHNRVAVCGNTRRGNFAAYLPVTHPDIDEFLDIRSDGHPIQNIFPAVTVPNDWMEGMRDGDRKKRTIWAKILKSRIETGVPYVMFSDNVNNNNPDVYKDKNMNITHSNLCVTGDQIAVTSKGLRKVKELYESGEDLVLFDGEKPVNASPMRLIEKNAPVFEILTEMGRSHKVTGYHKVKTLRGMVRAQDLKVGDRVCIQSKKGFSSENDVFHLNEEGQRNFIKSLKDGPFIHNESDIEELRLWQIYATNLGIQTKIHDNRLHYIEEKPIDYDIVTSVDAKGNEDVYCTTVDSTEHVWVCNGFITSNCSEIALADNDSESFVCDLSSMNIYHYDEWKNTDAVETMIYFLDAVMTEFIQKSKVLPHMERAYKFALNQRALGLGWLGWHSYLQSKMIPFESMEAKFLNSEVAKCIQEKSLKASKELAIKFGEPELLKGYGRRNVTLTAIAPTKSSAFIIGQVSEGIEPQRSNYYVKDTAKGKFTIKNKELEKLLKIKGKNTVEVWTQILHDSGSVRNLDFLSESEKDVFKTFSEISMKEVVIQAATRQKFIDQSQSLNILIHPATSTKDLNALMMFAWENGIKTMYYQHSMNAAQELGRNILECRSCSA